MLRASPRVSRATFTHISNGVQKLGHGLASFQFGLLHGLQFDENRVNLGHDASDGVFHAIHAAAKSASQNKCRQTTDKVVMWKLQEPGGA